MEEKTLFESKSAPHILLRGAGSNHLPSFLYDGEVQHGLGLTLTGTSVVPCPTLTEHGVEKITTYSIALPASYPTLRIYRLNLKDELEYVST